MTEPAYCVVLFKSVHHALRAEKVLKERGIPNKVIPVPRHISSDCGVCIRFACELQARVEDALAGEVEPGEIRSL